MAGLIISIVGLSLVIILAFVIIGFGIYCINQKSGNNISTTSH